MEHLTDKQNEVIAKVEKLLAIRTDRGATEEEMANAANLAMKLMELHNLDMAVVEKAGGAKKGKRDDVKTSGGLYQWQRDLWSAVAELNFCKYWAIRGLAKGSKYENRVLGRVENILATRVMAEYLEQAINRMAKEWVLNEYGPGTSVFISEAIGYREGLATRVASRLRALRYEREDEAKRKQEEVRTASRHPGAAPGTDIVLTSVIQDEADLNNDFYYGLEPGTTARQRIESEQQWKQYWAEKEKREKAAQQADDEWKARDPDGWAAAKVEEAMEEARAKAAEARKEAAKAKRRKAPTVYREKAYTAKDRARDAGYWDGEKIGLDQQVTGEGRNKLR